MATAATTLLKRYSYPKPPGDAMESVIDVQGPTSYVAFAAGVPPAPSTGGQLVMAKDFGLMGLDFVWDMAATNGLYQVAIVPDPALLTGEEFTQFRLVWLTGTGQVTAGTNLSAYSVRLLTRGR